MATRRGPAPAIGPCGGGGAGGGLTAVAVVVVQVLGGVAACGRVDVARIAVGARGWQADEGAEEFGEEVCHC